MRLSNELFSLWKEQGRLVGGCPERLAGFPTPRPAAEIVGSGEGAVLDNVARVREATGADVTDQFVNGARAALLVSVAADCRFAILKDGSPSCGSHCIRDGSFSGRVIEGLGVTAELFVRNGIAVFAETDIAKLQAIIERLEDLHG
jgi:uncharacterized protein YbbK (DUF523 family)